MADERAIHVVVTGRVQGVGYRYTAQRTAARMGLHGWVRNQNDGSVQLHAQGDTEVVTRFIEFLNDGPPAARVSEVVLIEAAIDPTFQSFVVRY